MFLIAVLESDFSMQGQPCRAHMPHVCKSNAHMDELLCCICRKSARQRKTAIWIRENLLALGPTFIKIGQLFSTRSDLLSAEYTEVCYAQPAKF